MNDFATVTAAQQLLAKGGQPIIPDGRWGKFTQAAFDKSSALTRAAVETLLAARGLSPARLLAGRSAERAASAALGAGAQVVPILKQDADRMVGAYARILGMSEHAQALMGFLRREARQVDGGRAYNARSTNGSSRGLMQMQPAAWSDASAYAELGDYERNVYDPNRNVLAGVAYAKANIRTLERVAKLRKKKVTLPINEETLYLMHNQGVGFFTNGTVTAYEKQSAEVRALIDKWRKHGI